MAVTICKVPMEDVQDTDCIEVAMKAEGFGADDIMAIVGKTEGNGGVNDFGRVLIDRVLRQFLTEKGTRTADEAYNVPIALSGGCDGIIAPHLMIYAKVADDPNAGDEARLAIGIAVSEPILPEEVGRVGGVEKVAAGVKLAMADAGIDDPKDIHYVQTKSPLLSFERIQDAKSRGQSVVTEETMESMAVGNATAALGVGVALGEISMPTNEQIGHDLDIYSEVASCSTGVEQDEAQIVVVGNKKGSGSRFRIGHSVMNDALDIDGIYAAIRDAGIHLPDRPRAEDMGDALVNVLIKCETDPSGRLRGRRLVSLNDSDVHHTHHTKATVGAVAAIATGDPCVFVSVAALQQGPAGGGLVAAIIDTNKLPK